MQKYTFLFVLAVFLNESALWAQQNIQAGKMTCTAQVLQDSIDIHLTAPTSGWLAVGFNKRNNIVQSDLIQLRVRDKKVEVQDQFVTGVGQHPEDTSLGGDNNVAIQSGWEEAGETSIHFRIPLRSEDHYDFQHQRNRKFWIILAYSLHDDFQHHSTMRQHYEIQWK